MPTSAATCAEPDPPVAEMRMRAHHRQAGFALIEMLVAMVLLSLVGLTLARFQTFQLAGAGSARLAAAARMEADNALVDVAIATEAPTERTSATTRNMGRSWVRTLTPSPAPDAAALSGFLQIAIEVREHPGGPVLARRTVMRPASNQQADPAETAGQRAQ